MTSEQRITRALAARERRTLPVGNATVCAVLVPLIETPVGYRVLYTRRTEHLPSHQGQVAFPGGRRSNADADLMRTALREAQEEVGLRAADARVLGALDDTYTLAERFVVTPYVAVVPDGYTYTPDPAEVADIFTVDLAELRRPDNQATEHREYLGQSYDLPEIRTGGFVIWGMTHGITLDLLDCLASAGL